MFLSSERKFNDKLATALESERRIIRVEMQQVNHENDCVQYRELTKKSYEALREEIRVNKADTNSRLDKIQETQDEQHKQNVAINMTSLKWQRGILITIILAVLGFAGAQMWEKVIVPALEKLPHETSFHGKDGDWRCGRDLIWTCPLQWTL